MKSSYAIAYADKYGKDFHGKPWILDDCNGKEECLLSAKRMEESGFQNVIPFQFELKRKKDEEFDWKYVKNHILEAWKM